MMQNRHSTNTTAYIFHYAGFCYDIDAPPSANPNNRINTPKGIFTVSDDRGNAFSLCRHSCLHTGCRDPPRLRFDSTKT